MYMWNTGALARDLRSGSVSDHDQMKYLLSSSLLLVVATEILVWSSEDPKPLRLLDLLGCLVVTVWGISSCYRANQRGDRKEFLVRFTCMSWPLNVRLLVGTIVVSCVYFALGYLVGGERFDRFIAEPNVVDVLFVPLALLVFYSRMRVHLSRISATK